MNNYKKVLFSFTGLVLFTALLTFGSFTAIQIQSLNILADGRQKSEFLFTEKISIQAEVLNDLDTDKIELIFVVYEPSGRKVYQHTGNFLSGKVGVEKSIVRNVPIEKFYCSSGEYLLECHAKSSLGDATARLKFNIVSPIPPIPEVTVPVSPPVFAPVSPAVLTPLPTTPVFVEPIATETTSQQPVATTTELSSVLPSTPIPFAVTPTVTPPTTITTHLPSTPVPSAVTPVISTLPAVLPATTTHAIVTPSAVLPSVPSAPPLSPTSELELYKELKKFILEALNLQFVGYALKRIKGVKYSELVEIIDQLKRNEARIVFTTPLRAVAWFTDEQKKASELTPQFAPQAIVISKTGSPTILPKDTIRWLKLDLYHLPRTSEVRGLLFSGDIVRTDSKSSLGIVFIDGTELKLNNSTEIALLDFKPEELLIKLRYGEIWCKSFSTERVKLLSVQSSLATVNTSGAEFNLELKDKLIVKVYDGEITLQTEKSKTTLQAGYECTVVAGKDTGEIEKTQKKTTWQEKLKKVPERKLELLMQLPDGKKKKIQLQFEIKKTM